MDNDRQVTIRKIIKLLTLASDTQVQRVYRILKFLIYRWPPDRA